MSRNDDLPVYSDLAADPLLRPMVELFVHEMPARTAILRVNFETGNWDALRRAAHQMKGAAGSYGFDQLTPPSARLEEAATRVEPAEVIAQALEALLAQCNRVTADPAS